MAEYPSTCLMCGAEGVTEWPDFDESDSIRPRSRIRRSALSDEAYDHQCKLDDFVDAYESQIKAGEHKYLCATCDDEVEARFRREGVSRDGTLAEILETQFRLSLIGALSFRCFATGEMRVPWVPWGVTASRIVRSRRGDFMLHVAIVVDLLRRVGKPVVIYFPAMEEDGEPFVLHELNEEGKYGTVFTLGPANSPAR